MKLRNKKTGEIVDVESLGHAESLKEKNGYQVTLSWATEYENLSQCKDYHSLAELNEEWEDYKPAEYKPAEPLIKDEKIRKAVRAWAEANGIENEAFYLCTPFYRLLRISTGSRSIEFPNDGRFGQIDFTKGYTIAELCGEEEE